MWSFPLGHAHNYYINMAAEAGVVGLGAYLFFLAATFGLCARLWRTATTPWGRARSALGALGVMVTVAVQGFFDNVFVHGMEVQVALVWRWSPWPSDTARSEDARHGHSKG